MSKVKWNWDPIPRMRRRSIRTVTTTTTTDVDVQSERMDLLFAQLKATSDVYRQRRNSRLSTYKPIEWSFKDMEISVSSDESNDSNDNQLSENRLIMTSTPQTNRKSCKQSVVTSANKMGPPSTLKKSQKALKALPNIAINGQTPTRARFTPIQSPKTSKSVKNSSKRKSMAMNTTSFARKSFVPEYMERTILDCTPCASPYTPKTAVKRKRLSRFDRTGYTNSYNTTLFNDNNNSIEKTFISTTTQTNDSLAKMIETQNISQNIENTANSSSNSDESTVKQLPQSIESSVPHVNSAPEEQVFVEDNGQEVAVQNNCTEDNIEVDDHISQNIENTPNSSSHSDESTVKQLPQSIESSVPHVNSAPEEQVIVEDNGQEVAVEDICTNDDIDDNNDNISEDSGNSNDSALDESIGSPASSVNSGLEEQLTDEEVSNVEEEDEEEEEEAVQNDYTNDNEVNDDISESSDESTAKQLSQSVESLNPSVNSGSEEQLTAEDNEQEVAAQDVFTNDDIEVDDNASEKSDNSNDNPLNKSIESPIPAVNIDPEKQLTAEDMPSNDDEESAVQNNCTEDNIEVNDDISQNIEKTANSSSNSDESTVKQLSQRIESLVPHVKSAPEEQVIVEDNGQESTVQNNCTEDNIEVNDDISQNIENTANSSSNSDESTVKQLPQSIESPVPHVNSAPEEQVFVEDNGQEVAVQNNCTEDNIEIDDDISQYLDNPMDESIGSPIPSQDSEVEDEPQSSGFSTETNGHKESEEHILENINESSRNGSVEEPQGLRRSRRQRIQPMEYWRGQRPIYKRDSSGVTEKIVAINNGIQDVVRQRKKPTKKRKFECDHKHHKDVNIFDLSIHNKKVKYNNENKNSLNIKSMEDLIWKKSSQSKGVDIAMINKNKEKGDALGMLRIKGMGEKKKSKTGGYTTHLTVTLGVLCLQMGDNEPVTIKTGDSFTVPSKGSYSLVNLRKDLSYVQFFVMKD